MRMHMDVALMIAICMRRRAHASVVLRGPPVFDSLEPSVRRMRSDSGARVPYTEAAKGVKLPPFA